MTHNKAEIKVACLMMQKNEGKLLEKWAKYHAALFGMTSLYIWDNGSTDSDTLKSLEQLSYLGANVDLTTSDPYCFNKKGVILRNKIRELDHESPFDFYFPTDCDEFLVLERNKNTISCEIDDIFEELKGLIACQQALSIDAAYYNVIGKPGFYWRKWHKKTFFTRDSIKELDHGYHEGTSKRADGRFHSKFVHMHFHYKPYAQHVLHSKEKMKSQVDVNNAEELLKMKDNRLIQFILEGEEAYMRRFDEPGAVEIDAFSQRLAKLNMQLPYS